jgi:hypothetical protein
MIPGGTDNLPEMSNCPSGCDAVRPTREVLEQMGLKPPTLYVFLHEMDNKHLRALQEVPALTQVRGSERIQKIRDRYWIKFKSSNVRAAVTKLREDEVLPEVAEESHLGRWWIGAFGYRQADTSQQDFYGKLPSDSESLLPTPWDRTRLKAELIALFHRRIQYEVIAAIAESMRTGKQVNAVAADHYVGALVRAPQRDEAYLVLGSGGIYDPKVIAVILDSVPGISPGDWLPEPSASLGIDPGRGEIVWSTMLSPEVQAAIVEIADRLYPPR